MELAALEARYQAFRAEADQQAGDLLDIPRRVRLLYQLYADSNGNHVFPLMAAHGALWAYRYFEVGGAVGRLIARRYFYNPRERAYRQGILDQFATDFRQVNRQVCVDTLANYRFTRELGETPGAEQFVRPSLLEQLNRIHAAARRSQSLDEPRRRELFSEAFRCEQELTVAPGVAAAIAAFECPFMQFICLHPIVRFSFFPRLRYFFFRNFGNKDERIRRGLQAYDLGRQAGWERVLKSLADYRVMPLDQILAPVATI